MLQIFSRGGPLLCIVTLKYFYIFSGTSEVACKNVLTSIHTYVLISTSNKNIHFEMILDVGIGEKRKETRFLI